MGNGFIKNISLLFVVYSLALLNAWSAELSEDKDYTPLKNKQENVLYDFRGKTHDLTEYTGKGKWLIVMIWVSDCHVCNKEVKNYIEFHNKHKDKDATILGISIDGWEKKKDALAFIDRHKVTFPNLIGSPEGVTELYAQLTGGFMVGTPTFLVFSPAGELLAQQTGAVPVETIEEFIQTQSSAQGK